jgi:hypothetical protein
MIKMTGTIIRTITSNLSRDLCVMMKLILSQSNPTTPAWCILPSSLQCLALECQLQTSMVMDQVWHWIARVDLTKRSSGNKISLGRAVHCLQVHLKVSFSKAVQARILEVWLLRVGVPHLRKTKDPLQYTNRELKKTLKMLHPLFSTKNGTI